MWGEGGGGGEESLPTIINQDNKVTAIVSRGLGMWEPFIFHIVHFWMGWILLQWAYIVFIIRERIFLQEKEDKKGYSNPSLSFPDLNITYNWENFKVFLLC